MFDAFSKHVKQEEAHNLLPKCPDYIRNNAEVLNFFCSMKSKEGETSGSWLPLLHKVSSPTATSNAIHVDIMGIWFHLVLPHGTTFVLLPVISSLNGFHLGFAVFCMKAKLVSFR
ncbi:hypothetical protein K1719_034620 [Acacia pycnantha]|nr:hypothetical protein K1719_034620 [Acacia pycnantha]